MILHQALLVLQAPTAQLTFASPPWVISPISNAQTA
jgi:hypothetical protein